MAGAEALGANLYGAKVQSQSLSRVLKGQAQLVQSLSSKVRELRFPSQALQVQAQQVRSQLAQKLTLASQALKELDLSERFLYPGLRMLVLLVLLALEQLVLWRSAWGKQLSLLESRVQARQEQLQLALTQTYQSLELKVLGRLEVLPLRVVRLLSRLELKVQVMLVQLQSVWGKHSSRLVFKVRALLGQ
jgi:hypothetical protein